MRNKQDTYLFEKKVNEIRGRKHKHLPLENLCRYKYIVSVLLLSLLDMTTPYDNYMFRKTHFPSRLME